MDRIASLFSSSVGEFQVWGGCDEDVSAIHELALIFGERPWTLHREGAEGTE